MTFNGSPVEVGAGSTLMLGETAPVAPAQAVGDSRPDSVDRPIKNAVILGGGPGGLATAIELAKQNVKVTIVEVRDEHYSRPHQLNVRQATVDTLAMYGVEKEVRQSSGWDPTRALPGDPSRVSSDPESLIHSPSVGQVRISDVEKALYDQANKLGIQYLSHSVGVLAPPPADGPNKGLYGLTVRDADQNDGHFTPTGKSVDFGHPDLVIAADGANSPTRQLLGIPFQEMSAAKPYLGGLVHKSIGAQYKQMTMTENGEPVHVMATGHALYPQTWISAEVDSAHANMSESDRVAYFCNEASQITGQDVKPEDIDFGKGQLTKVQNREAATASAGDNVVLIGDAARTGSVWVSGGLNLALTTDVANVVKMVKDVNSGEVNRSQALQAYDQSTLAATKCWHEAGARELGGLPAAPVASARVQ